jgi:SAM-dependent methyltransferase
MPLVIVFLIVIIGWLIWKYWTLAVGAGYDPTPMPLVYKMLDLGQVSSSDIVYDLGSGDGRIVIAAARRHGAQAVGIEIDPFRYLFAKFAVLFAGLRRQVTIKYGSMYVQDISQATVVTLFLYQPTNNKLKEKLLEELPPGARIVTYMWTFDGWYHTKYLPEDEIYLYIIGEHGPGDH